jgi:thioredoxin
MYLSRMTLTAIVDATFAQEVLEAPQPVLVDIWAPWCAPCVALKPVLERVAEQLAGRVKVLTLNADENLETVTRFGVRALPTVLLFDRGALVDRLTGAHPIDRYLALLAPVLEARAAGAPVPAPPAPVAPWSARPAGRATSAAHDEARALADSPEALVVFKHSATCIISLTVIREFEAFRTALPDVPTRLVVVQQERALSNALEDVLQVQHESPQALVVQQGRALWHASHRRITADRLAQAVGRSIPTPVTGSHAAS